MTRKPLLAHSHHLTANTFLLCLRYLIMSFLLFNTVLGILPTFYIYILEITIIVKNLSDLLLYALAHLILC